MNTAPHAHKGEPHADDVRAQVARMTKSHVFANSPQLSAFLLFVVEALLRGKSERLKGYTIGVEVLRRDASFDPQLDPIVRVEATRLRRAIERYYAGPGAGDAVMIETGPYYLLKKSAEMLGVDIRANSGLVGV